MKEFDLEYVKEHWEEAQAGNLVQTRIGRPVRLLCLDAKQEYPIVGLVIRENGAEEVLLWALNGKYDNVEDEYFDDLVIKTIKYEGWMNIYQGEGDNLPYGGTIHDTEESALNAKSKHGKAIATVKVEWEE